MQRKQLVPQWMPCTDETVRNQIERLKQDEPKVHAFWLMVAAEIEVFNAACTDSAGRSEGG